MKIMVLIVAFLLLISGCADTSQTSDTAPTVNSESQLPSEFMVKYAIRFRHVDSDEGIDSFTQTNRTYYLKGTSRKIMDDRFGREIMIAYLVDGKTTSCMQRGNSIGCFNTPDQNPKELTPTKQDDQDLDSFASAPSREVVGIRASCYKNRIGDIEMCFSPEGLMLYQRVTIPVGSNEIVATEYSTKVEDSVFVIPISSTS
jgi:hypothetical protein